MYLTDGRALLRVDTRIDIPGHEPLFGLEDCRTLDMVMWPARDLVARGLRRVTPTRSDEAPPARRPRTYNARD
jgi:hypothetical protein